jgi:hypothetical protein
MKTKLKLGAALLSAALALATPAPAAPQAKTYQVTGPVVEITETYIAVKKGDEIWQVARDAGTRIKGELKVGEKVTIQYRMTAVEVEIKPAK